MRRMKSIGIAAVCMLFALVSIGCTNDAAAETVMSELDSLTTDMVKEIEASPNDAGIDRALKILEERRGKIKAAAEELKAGPVSEEMKTKYDASIDASFKKFIVVTEKYETELFSDERLGKRFIAMINEIKKLFTGE